MNEQNGESKEEEVTDEKEIKGVHSRDKVKHNERSDQLFSERMM